jgi:hypothetical protein
MDLPNVLGGRMRQTLPSLHGLTLAQDSAAAAPTIARPYSVAVASFHRPWVTRVGMESLTSVLAGAD